MDLGFKFNLFGIGIWKFIFGNFLKSLLLLKRTLKMGSSNSLSTAYLYYLTQFSYNLIVKYQLY